MALQLRRLTAAGLLLAAAALAPSVASAQDADRRLQQIETQLNTTEPSVDEVIAAALEFYHLDDDTIDSYDSRAEWKAIVPRVGAEFRQNSLETNVDKFDFLQAPNQQAAEDSIGGTTQEFKVSATWDLPKLIYNPEVLDVHSLRGTRQDLVKEVIRLYYLRRRLKINFLLEPPTDAASRVAAQLRIDETTATLDAITGNIFRDYAKRKKDQ